MISSGFLPVIDGVTVTLWHRLQVLSKLGHHVLLLCPSYDAIASAYPNWTMYVGEILPGIRVVSLNSHAFMGMDFDRNPNPMSYKMVLRALEQFQPDLIQVDEPDRLFLGFFRFPGIDYAKKYRIPCLGFFHTNFIEYIEDFLPTAPTFVVKGLQEISRFTISRVCNAYDVTLVASTVTYNKISKMGIKNARYDEFLGVDIANFTSGLKNNLFFEQKYGLELMDSKIKLLFLGRLTPDKGWLFLLEALRAAAKVIDFSRVAMVIAGDGPLRETIQKELAGVAPHITLLGRVDRSQVPALLANSDIHITASQRETRGLTVFEAWASGIPVLAVRAGGLIDSIDEGINGLMFTPGDHQDFTAKLQRLIEDVKLRQQLGLKGRADAQQHSWDKAVDRLLHVWDEQIELKKSSGSPLGLLP